MESFLPQEMGELRWQRVLLLAFHLPPFRKVPEGRPEEGGQGAHHGEDHPADAAQEAEDPHGLHDLGGQKGVNSGGSESKCIGGPNCSST